MQPVEMCFNNTIEKHGIFRQAASSLIEELPGLTPSEIQLRCKQLDILYNDLISNKEYLLSLMEFVGPGILDTSYIGEFQRALEKSIATCDELYQEIVNYKINNLSETES